MDVPACVEYVAFSGWSQPGGRATGASLSLSGFVAVNSPVGLITCLHCVDAVGRFEDDRIHVIGEGDAGACVEFWTDRVRVGQRVVVLDSVSSRHGSIVEVETLSLEPPMTEYVDADEYRPGWARIEFDDGYLVQPGDSGSAVFDAGSMQFVGLMAWEGNLIMTMERCCE